MKFTILALLVTLSVVTVSANVADSPDVSDNLDIEIFKPQDFAKVVPEEFSIFSKSYWALRKSLRTLKGINCTIKYVTNIKNVAERYIADVKFCGVESLKQIQAVITACTDIINTCNDIIHLNENVCNNNNYNDAVDGNKKSPAKCFAKLLKKLRTLKKQVEKTVKLTKKVPNIGADTNDCVMDATNKLTTTFTQFPSNVVECSKLTSK